MIVKNQSTADIVDEVLRAHTIFSGDYSKLAEYFAAVAEDEKDLPGTLFDFCKKNIAYKIEPEKLQTTRSPGAVLHIGSGDCKHYSGFIAGVVDALNRLGYYSVPWCYRFVSYDLFNADPVHVFVVLYPGTRGEIWLDPVLKNMDQRSPKPVYTFDKKPLYSMAMMRISGAPEGRQYVTADYPNDGLGAVGFSLPDMWNPDGTSNNYTNQAAALSSLDGLATSAIPFLSLAQGLVTQFFGKGGISDWLSPTGILNELKFALTGRAYRGGQYWLGEKFRFYVLGEDIHTRDADIVTDAAVQTAITTFSVGFGVPIEDYQDILNLQTGRDAYIARYVSMGANRADINTDAVDRAVTLKRLYFPTTADAQRAGPPPEKWDLNNFNRVPLVAPIPNFTAHPSQMWLQTYTGPIPDGEVKNGVVIAGPLAEGSAQLPAPAGSGGGLSTGSLLLIGGGILAAFLLLTKKR